MTLSIRVLAITNGYPTEKDPSNTPGVKDQLDALETMGVSTDLLHIQYGKTASYLAAALKILLLNFQFKNYDIIQTYYGHCGLLARLQLRYPVVATFLGSDILCARGAVFFGNKDTVIGRIAALLANYCIVMNKQMQTAINRQACEVIPFGVATNAYFPTPLQQARQELGLPPDKKLVLFPWNPNRQHKRFDIVQQAVDILNQHMQDVQIIAISEKPRQRLAMFMNACDVMAVASDNEGAPMAVREAMACNLPLVSVNAGDIWEVIDGVSNCYRCERDPQDMAAKLGLALNSNQRSDGTLKIQTMDAKWSASQVLQIYKKILGIN